MLVFESGGRTHESFLSAAAVACNPDWSYLLLMNGMSQFCHARTTEAKNLSRVLGCASQAILEVPKSFRALETGAAEAKTRRRFVSVWKAILPLAIVAAGCTSNSLSTDSRLGPSTSIPPPWHYRNAYIEPDWHKVTKLLDVIEDPKASAAARHHALKKIRPLKVIEKPGFWASILESPRFDDEHKRVCLTLLFTRHIPPGTRLTELAGIEGVSKWFTPSNVLDDAFAQNHNLSSRGAQMFFLQPPLLVYDYGKSSYYDPNGGISFSVSKKMTVDELITAVNTAEKWDGPELDDTYIVDLVASPGIEKSTLK